MPKCQVEKMEINAVFCKVEMEVKVLTGKLGRLVLEK